MKQDINPFLSALKSPSSHQAEDVFIPQPNKYSYRPPPPGSVRMSKMVENIRSHDPRQTAQMIPGTDSKSLHLKGVPDVFNNQDDLSSHFSKFGPIQSIVCDTNKRFADVHFITRVTIVTMVTIVT